MLSLLTDRDAWPLGLALVVLLTITVPLGMLSLWYMFGPSARPLRVLADLEREMMCHSMATTRIDRTPRRAS